MLGVNGTEVDERSADGTEAERETYPYNILSSLVSIRESSFQLTRLPQESRRGRVVNAIRVERDGQWLQTIYFDAKSHCLAAEARPYSSPPGNLGIAETVYSDYREFDGIVAAHQRHGVRERREVVGKTGSRTRIYA